MPRTHQDRGDRPVTLLTAHLLVAEMGPAARAAFDLRCQVQGRRAALEHVLSRHVARQEVSS